MFLTNYNYGIKLIDLVDYTNPDITFSDVVDVKKNILLMMIYYGMILLKDLLENLCIEHYHLIHILNFVLN